MSNININDVNAFLGIMDNWIKHPLFQKISRVRHERHWAKNLNLKENNYSDILRWLLDTDEGHGLGDYFLKKFIVSVMNKSGENILNEWFSFIEINLFRLNSIVVREVIIKNNENGFIDILVVDNYNKFVIVIERKDGSCIRDGQLDKYHTWLKENYIKYGYKYLLCTRQFL